ncbi:MAG: hypothetical protein HOP14_07820 [Acidobacteria bacterium]|nr:hypothetical protein [Acidobacteriota bacterium]
MFIRSRHLADDRIVDACLDGALSASEAGHLDACPGCDARRAEFSRLLMDVSVAAAEGADEAFPEARLTRQRSRIMQRLVQHGQPGRLLAFPGSAIEPAPLSARPRPATRWIAAAAAAGLALGLLAGHLTDRLTPANSRRASQAVLRSLGDTGSAQSVGTVRQLSEEEFLSELDAAVSGVGSDALRPFDALTPRISEVALRE